MREITYIKSGTNDSAKKLNTLRRVEGQCKEECKVSSSVVELYMQSKMRKSSFLPLDFKISEKKVYINTIIRLLCTETKSSQFICQAYGKYFCSQTYMLKYTAYRSIINIYRIMGTCVMEAEHRELLIPWKRWFQFF
jgi:hypothetical protein